MKKKRARLKGEEKIVRNSDEVSYERQKQSSVFQGLQKDVYFSKHCRFQADVCIYKHDMKYSSIYISF